jgi:hypothetical protein
MHNWQGEASPDEPRDEQRPVQSKHEPPDVTTGTTDVVSTRASPRDHRDHADTEGHPQGSTQKLDASSCIRELQGSNLGSDTHYSH